MAWLAVGLAAAVVASYFLPWALSGRAQRTAFALVRTIEDLGLAGGRGDTALVVGFWASPALAAGALAAGLLGQHRVAAALASAVGVVAVVGALVVMRASAVQEVSGAWLGMVAGTGAMVMGAWAALTGRVTGR